jgi:hypothetical protein
LYKTTDYGKTWLKITNGIGEEDFARVIREDPVRRGLLYAGTETGVYASLNGGASWFSLQRNLPVVPAQYMQVKHNDLVVATHGRGFWIMDNLTPLRQMTNEVTSAPAHLFDIPTTHRYLPIQVLSPRRPVRPGMQFARSGDVVTYEDRKGADGRVRRVFLNAGENPSGGVAIDYALKQPAGEVTLTVADGQGQVIRRFSSQANDGSWMPAEIGTNRFFWDLRYPGAQEIPAPGGFVPAEYGRAQAPVATPGRYTARLSAGGRQYERTFEIARDPRLTATDDDLRAQFDLMVEIRDRVTAITEAVDRLRKARQQLEPRSRSGDAAAVGALQTLQAIESALTRLPGPSPYMLPPKALNNRLAALSSDVGGADTRPTRQMYDVFKDLSGLVAEQVRRLDEAVQRAGSLQ